MGASSPIAYNMLNNQGNEHETEIITDSTVELPIHNVNSHSDNNEESESEDMPLPAENNITITEDRDCNKTVNEDPELSEFITFKNEEPVNKKRKIADLQNCGQEEKLVNKNTVLLRPVALNQSSLNVTNNNKFVKLTVTNDHNCKDDRIMAHIQPMSVNSASSVASGKSTPVELVDIFKMRNEKHHEDSKSESEKDSKIDGSHFLENNSSFTICETIKYDLHSPFN